MRNLVCFLMAVMVWISCGDKSTSGNSGNPPSPAATAGKAGETDKTGPYLRFFQGETIKGMREKGNWCYEEYPEAIVITGDPLNSNRRRFGMGAGVYKVTLDLGTSANSFILRSTPDGAIDLFTSDNYPLCLANRANFQLDPDARGFQYDNGHMFKYAVELQPQNDNGLFVAVDFSSGRNYGLTVRRCASCR
ncbi:MAG: hypothetical protein WCR52_08825 [Bacteroidota bacterium]